MKTVTLLNVVATIFVLGFVGQGPAQAEGVPTNQTAAGANNGLRTCSLATLQGDYILTGHAEFAQRSSDDPRTFPRVVVGVQYFDGQGNVRTVITRAEGGDIIHAAGDGTYTINEDCTGTTSGGVDYEMVVTRDGREGELIRMDQGHVARRSIKKM